MFHIRKQNTSWLYCLVGKMQGKCFHNYLNNNIKKLLVSAGHEGRRKKERMKEKRKWKTYIIIQVEIKIKGISLHKILHPQLHHPSVVNHTSFLDLWKCMRKVDVLVCWYTSISCKQLYEQYNLAQQSNRTVAKTKKRKEEKGRERKRKKGREEIRAELEMNREREEKK
jgi:hypothetical protein